MELALVQEPGTERQAVGPDEPQELVLSGKGQKIHPQQQRDDFTVGAHGPGPPFALQQVHAMGLIPVVHQHIHHRRHVGKGYTGQGKISE